MVGWCRAKLVVWWALAAMLLVGCSDGSDSSVTSKPASLRDIRYCELLAIQLDERGFFADIYNTYTLNDCPPDAWNEIDAVLLAEFQQQLNALILAKNGPRFWLMNEISSGREQFAGTRQFNGIEMGYGPQIVFGPEPPQPALYSERSVLRDTVFLFKTGSEIYELIAPLGKRYVMQSYASFVDTSLTIDRLPNLSERIELPQGWQYRARHVEEALQVEDWQGIATVVQDELSNTYQRAVQLEGVPDGLQSVEFLNLTSREAWIAFLPPDEVDAIVVESGWIRSPLRLFSDRSVFARSPDETTDGRFQQMELFGHAFTHNVTVEQFGTALEPERLLTEMWVRKAQELTYFAGSELPVIVGPTGQAYVLVATRGEISPSVPTLPSGWSYQELLLESDLRVVLPPRTRLLEPGSTGMSFQGPVDLDLN